MNNPKRFVVAHYRLPFFYLKFVDLDSENSSDWQHNSAEGVMTLDLANDIGVNASGVILQAATQLWCAGTSFTTISRKFPDN
jgi:outer membrane protease